MDGISSELRKGQKMKEKTVKATLYLPPEMYEDVKDLAHVDGVTWTEYVSTIIKRDVEAKRETLRAFRAIRNEAKQENPNP